jgi:hypothetical protein
MNRSKCDKDTPIAAAAFSRVNASRGTVCSGRFAFAFDLRCRSASGE